jgi:hypothetical protein
MCVYMCVCLFAWLRSVFFCLLHINFLVFFFFPLPFLFPETRRLFKKIYSGGMYDVQHFICEREIAPTRVGRC